MATDKTVLFELDIDADSALKDMALLQSEVKRLQSEIKELSKAEGDNSVETAKLTAELKNQQKALREQTTLVQAEIKLENENISTLEKLQAENVVLRTERNRLNLETEEGQKRLAELNSALDANNAKIKENSDKQKQQALNVGNYKDSVKEAIQETGGLNLAFVKLLKNPVALVIAAIVGTIKLLIDSFKKTQAGSDKLNSATAQLSAAFEVLQGYLATVATALVEAFENPQQALKDFAKLLKDNIVNRFEGMIKLLPELGKAIGLIFEGEFSEAARTAGDAVAMVALGVENFTEKASDGINEMSADFEAATNRAKKLQAAQISLENAVIRHTTAIAKYNKEAELQQAIADDSTKSFAERQEAADKAREANEKALKSEIDLSKQRLAIIQLEIHQKKEAGFATRQLAQQEADARAAVIDAEKNLTLKMYENARIREEINRDLFEKNLDYLIDNFDRFKTMNEKELSDTKKTYEQRKAIIENTRQLQETAFKEQIAELQTRTDETINANELVNESDTRRLLEKVRLLKLDEKEETRLLEVLRERSVNIGDLAQMEREMAIENAEQLKAFRENEAIRDIEAARQTAFTKIEIERLRLETQYQEEIKAAQKIGAETTGITERYNKAQQQLDKATFEAKLELASGFAGNIATIFGEQTAIGKTAAIAETTINTYKGAQAAYASLAPVPVVGPALGIAAAGAAVAAGLANVKKIMQVDSGLPGSGSGGGNISGGGGGARPTAPSINEGIVSRETLTNQKDSINVQPTLVIDDVVNAQNNNTNNNKTSLI